MAETCANCSHYDVESTELPVCSLHRRFMHAEWSCRDFIGRHVTDDDRARYGEEVDR